MAVTLCFESVLYGVEGNDLFKKSEHFVAGGCMREVSEGRAPSGI
jgi:hypothetical protein